MITILEADGVRQLHFGTPAVQGAMRLSQPHDLELEYVQQMMIWLLFRESAHDITQLGLGAASLTKFSHRYLAPARITAVERDPNVVDACRHHFFLPPDDKRLVILVQDAWDYVNDPARRRSLDILQVDLYDALAHSPTLGSQKFYSACARSLRDDGMMVVNLYCDWPEHMEHIERMEAAFKAVAWLPPVHDSNIVAIAFKEPPSVEFEALYERADQISAAYGLNARSWVAGLEEWMHAL